MSEIIYLGTIRPFYYKDSKKIFKEIKGLFPFKKTHAYFSETEKNCLIFLMTGNDMDIKDYLKTIKDIQDRFKKVNKKYKFSWGGQIFMGGIDTDGLKKRGGKNGKPK